MHVYKENEMWVAEEDDGELRAVYSIAELEEHVAWLRTQITEDTEFTLEARYTLKRPATEAEIAQRQARDAAVEAQRKASRKADYDALKREFEQA